MCIELGAFLIVSTRPDDGRTDERTDGRSLSYIAVETNAAASTAAAAAAPARAREVVFRRLRRNLFRMNAVGQAS